MASVAKTLKKSTPRPIAEVCFDVRGTTRQMRLSIYPPRLSQSPTWGCRYVIGPPMKLSRTIYGENGVQALVLALKAAAADLYGSTLYRNGDLGIYGHFGEDLSIPAPNCFLDVAPYP